MSSFSAQISQSTDDAKESTSNAVVTNGTTFVLSNTTSAAWVGLRWAASSIQGVTVSAASISLWPTTTATINDTIDFQNTASGLTFNSGNSADISSRTLTGHAVTWNTSLTSGAFRASPDLTTAVQQVVNLASMTELVAVLVNSGGPTVEAFDGNAAEAAEINVTYTAAAGPTTDVLAAIGDQTGLNAGDACTLVGLMGIGVECYRKLTKLWVPGPRRLILPGLAPAG